MPSTRPDTGVSADGNTDDSDRWRPDYRTEPAVPGSGHERQRPIQDHQSPDGPRDPWHVLREAPG